jgi:DNA gyrase subunit A
MRLRRLTGLERTKIEEELAELKKMIAWYKKVLADEKLVEKLVKDELAEVREKYANERRTEISSEAKDLDVEDLIAEEDMVVTITKAGYVKRLPVATYRQQRRGGKGKAGVDLKENDFVEHLFVSSTHDYVLFFSTKGKVYRLKVHELPVGSRHARGTAAVNLLPFDQDERIAAAITTKDFPEDDRLLFATRDGLVKKTAMKAYDRSRRDGIIAIKLREGDELISVRRVQPGQRVVMVSNAGKAIVWDEADARPMGRDTMGVKGMNVKGDDFVLGMEIAPADIELLVVTERGYGKRTPVDQYPVQKRGGMGVKTIQVTEKKGPLAAMKVVRPDHELMLISEEGVVIRVGATGISSLGRSTQGVKIMDVSETDRVSAVARVTAKKKRRRTAGVGEGQETLQVDAEKGLAPVSDHDALAEELASEEFEDEGEE